MVGGACVAGEMTTAVVGAHPTGIHSCFNYVEQCTQNEGISNVQLWDKLSLI